MTIIKQKLNNQEKKQKIIKIFFHSFGLQPMFIQKQYFLERNKITILQNI
jgi:hypothetical protein